MTFASCCRLSTALDIDNKEWLTLLAIYTQGYTPPPRGSVLHHSIYPSELSRFTAMERSQTLPNYVYQMPFQTNGNTKLQEKLEIGEYSIKFFSLSQRFNIFCCQRIGNLGKEYVNITF